MAGSRLRYHQEAVSASLGGGNQQTMTGLERDGHVVADGMTNSGWPSSTQSSSNYGSSATAASGVATWKLKLSSK